MRSIALNLLKLLLFAVFVTALSSSCKKIHDNSSDISVYQESRFFNRSIRDQIYLAVQERNLQMPDFYTGGYPSLSSQIPFKYIKGYQRDRLLDQYNEDAFALIDIDPNDNIPAEKYKSNAPILKPYFGAERLHIVGCYDEPEFKEDMKNFPKEWNKRNCVQLPYKSSSEVSKYKQSPSICIPKPTPGKTLDSWARSTEERGIPQFERFRLDDFPISKSKAASHLDAGECDALSPPGGVNLAGGSFFEQASQYADDVGPKTKDFLKTGFAALSCVNFVASFVNLAKADGIQAGLKMTVTPAPWRFPKEFYQKSNVLIRTLIETPKSLGAPASNAVIFKLTQWVLDAPSKILATMRAKLAYEALRSLKLVPAAGKVNRYHSWIQNASVAFGLALDASNYEDEIEDGIKSFETFVDNFDEREWLRANSDVEAVIKASEDEEIKKMVEDLLELEKRKNNSKATKTAISTALLMGSVAFPVLGCANLGVQLFYLGDKVRMQNNFEYFVNAINDTEKTAINHLSKNYQTFRDVKSAYDSEVDDYKQCLDGDNPTECKMSQAAVGNYFRYLNPQIAYLFNRVKIDEEFSRNKITQHKVFGQRDGTFKEFKDMFLEIQSHLEENAGYVIVALISKIIEDGKNMGHDEAVAEAIRVTPEIIKEILAEEEEEAN